MTLVDTNIFIEVFKGNADVYQRLESLDPRAIGLSAITVMELYCGAINKLELQRIKKHMGAFQICHITQSISERSVDLIARYSKSHGLQIPDAIIAATAMDFSSPLMTLNVRDFRFIEGLQLL